MAKRKVPIRHFRQSDSELVQLTDKISKAAERDFSELKKFGLSKEEINKAKKLRDKFIGLSTDEEILAEKTAATDNKNQSRDELKAAMKAVLNRISLHFGKSSAELKKAGGENLSNLSDAQLCQKGRRVERSGREYSEALQAVGLSNEILEQLNKVVNLFDDLIDEQKDLTVQRDIKTRERVNMANELYDIVVKLSDYGKAAFESNKPALFESYKLGDQPRKSDDTTDEIQETSDEEVD